MINSEDYQFFTETTKNLLEAVIPIMSKNGSEMCISISSYSDKCAEDFYCLEVVGDRITQTRVFLNEKRAFVVMKLNNKIAKIQIDSSEEEAIETVINEMIKELSK